MDDIVSFYQGHGVDYETIHAEHYRRYGEVSSHRSVSFVRQSIGVGGCAEYSILFVGEGDICWMLRLFTCLARLDSH